MMKTPVMAAYGGGVNSTALLVGMVERDACPDAILFADTGGEKPETYAYVEMFSQWLHDNGLPRIVTVSNDGRHRTLENNCLQSATLPSIAYGRKACSEKYKQRPQHKWAKRWQPALDCWKEGGRVVKLIGYGADEVRRAGIREDDFYVYAYPLIEWGWRRQDCIDAIHRNDLPDPIKSACFFCPSSSKPEVLWLAENHPELFDRAARIEKTAGEGGGMESVKGLGRRFSWRRLVEHDRSQRRLFPVATADEEAERPSCFCLSPVDLGGRVDGDDSGEEEDE